MWICDIGKALEHIGSVSEEDCVPCVPGTVNGQDGMLNCGECQSSTEFAIEEGEAAVDRQIQLPGEVSNESRQFTFHSSVFTAGHAYGETHACQFRAARHCQRFADHALG